MGLFPKSIALLLAMSGLFAHADPARFDLPGPKIDIRVTRGGMTLPIASVPNLQPGDQLWVHADLPPTQSVHYLLIVAFLRGTTNPPPDDWFTRIETWKHDVREEGATVTVPADAQQAVLFLAPETGGDFGTLRSAVRGRPGVFVRASQDLTEASFEQTRLEKYLASMKLVPPGDEAALLTHSNLLARTLALRPNADCFKRPLDQQYMCLIQTGSQTLLDDGHGQTLAAALSTGPGSDLIQAASYTGVAGGGNYSAYVGALVDFVRVMNSLRTAQYQYIPALALPAGESLNLKLNTAPSFHNPKSVLVIGMPAIASSVLPPLRPADPNHVSCLLDPRLVLPLEGAPLVFSTNFAHDLVLHLNGPAPAGMDEDLPLVADAYRGGLEIGRPAQRRELPLAPVHTSPVSLGKQASPAAPAYAVPATLTGTVTGLWGFDRFTGPTVPLQAVPGAGWQLAPPASPSAVLVAGEPNHLQLTSSGTACVRSVTLEPGATKVDWMLTTGAEAGPDSKVPASKSPDSKVPDGTLVIRPVEVTLTAAETVKGGTLHLAVEEFGRTAPETVAARTFSEPATINAIHLHVGDSSAEIVGTHLAQVTRLVVRDRAFIPGPSDVAQLPDSGAPLPVKLDDAAAPPALKPGEKLTAEVVLDDGRRLPVTTEVLPRRPEIAILSRKRVDPTPSPIQLNGAVDTLLPLGTQLTFALKSPTPFGRAEQIEIANADLTLKTTLSVSSGSLLLEDAHTVLATFDPLKSFGPSTFGYFHLRAIAADGTEGAWVPLATIVRLPALTDLRCPANAALACTLTGASLFFVDSLAADSTFTAPVRVPDGFVENTLNVPHPSAAGLFLRLRDDPTASLLVNLPVTSDTPPQAHEAHTRTTAATVNN